ncbi:MAG TPA: protein kinase [Gemmatimonadales bacterium]|nr:protein kinase [Gemmatimonadales bacterium]
MTDLRTRLEAALGATYRLESELGGGGMSRVFLAEEVALGRQVVIKVLPPEMGAGVNEDRFRREIQLAARLQHPHIVPLLAAGSADGLLWYAMPFVEGQSLRARLERGGELPVEEAVRILREVTDALAYAHEKGVVHRDIKPDNVMLSGNHALVTDFGVAKAVTDSATGGGALTSLGLALGTPAYMAPEQASADPNVDQRADLYALGAMGYEMLTGRPPFTAPTPQAVLAAHLIQAPEKLSAIRPAVPPPLEALLHRCLEKRPADRWQRAADVLPQLEAMLMSSGSTAPYLPQGVVSSGTELALRRTHPVRVSIVFALAALLVLTVTWWLVNRLGLPDWVMMAAGVLLLAGLPIMVVAARHEQRRILARKAGAAPSTPDSFLGRLTTLRGAMAGGGLAFGGLAVGAGVFMLLRVLGVGPFATLLSAGVLKERSLLVIADFATGAEDSTLAGSITEALRIDLGQSPSIRLLEGRQVAQALERMQRPADAPIDLATAQDIAQREGASAVVAGEVSRLGGGYVLSARLVSATDGSTLLGVRESSPDQAGLIAAVDRISKQLREGIGESLRSIRSGEPLEQVTTTSLEALRLYTQGEHARDAGRLEESVRLWEQAIAADSNFAMAWRKLSVALFNTGGDAERQFAAAQRAYDLRDRLPRREADLAVAYYFQSNGERPEAIAAYERMLATWPDEVPARNNLALLLNLEQRYSESERLLRAVTDSGTTVAAFYDNLIDAQLFQRKYAAAESTVARYASAVPVAVGQRQYFSTSVAFAGGDFARAAATADSMRGLEDRTWKSYAEGQGVRLNVLRGRIGKARAAAEANPIIGDASANADRLGREVAIAEVEGLLQGDLEAAGRRLGAAIERYPLDSVPPRNRDYPYFVYVAAMLDRPDLVARLEADYRPIRGTGRNAAGDAAWVRASVAATRGDWSTVVEETRQAQQRWGCPVCALPMVGRAFDEMGQVDSALAVFEDYASRPMYYTIGQEVDLPRVLVRLGELYETKGDKAKALEYYGKFVDLWTDADPELQPRVAEIRKRIGQLAGEPGAS